MMDRQTWFERILEATRDLADERYQERVWVRGAGPEVDSSTEALVRLMDDYDLATFIAEAADKAWVSSPQLAALRRLDAALAHYAAHDQGSDDAARLATPERRRVRDAAAATLQNYTARAASS